MPVAHTSDVEQPESESPVRTDEPAPAGVGEITDELHDLTDRRRVLIRLVFGVDAKPQDLDLVFASPELG